MSTLPLPEPKGLDGCMRACRTAGEHTRVWGDCAFGIEPEPTVSMSVVYKDHDGYNSIGFETFTVQELADLIEPALRAHPGAQHGDLARAAAHAVIHRKAAS